MRTNGSVSRIARSRSRGRSIGTISRTRPGIGRHHQHPLAEERRLVDRVGDEQDGRAGLLPDAAQLLVQPVARDLVERAERLVHQQEPRPAEQRARDRDALAHAAGELVREAVLPAFEADQLQQLARRRRLGRQRARRRRPRAAARRSAAPCARAAARHPGTRSRARARCRASCGDMPKHRISPLVGAIRSATTRSRVDLPQPDGPSRLRNPPRSTENETFSSAVTVRRSVTKRTVTLRHDDRRAAAAGHGGGAVAAAPAAWPGAVMAQPTFGRLSAVILRMSSVMTSSSFGVRLENWPSSA